jgi:hypothetical protein
LKEIGAETGQAQSSENLGPPPEKRIQLADGKGVLKDGLDIASISRNCLQMRSDRVPGLGVTVKVFFGLVVENIVVLRGLFHGHD